MGTSLRLIGLLTLLAVSPLWAGAPGESVFLQNGFKMRAERHETTDNGLRFYLPGGGWVDVRAEDVARIETDDPAPAPVVLEPVARLTLDDIVKSTGVRYGLDPDLIRSMIATESAGNPRAVSPKGAQGLMQLMPGTARLLEVTDSFDPAQNVEAGTRYIRQLLAQYHDDLGMALAAYNAGPGKVDAYKGVPPYRETVDYVSRVIRSFNQKKLAVKKRTEEQN